MKPDLLKYFFYLILSFNFLLGACRSQKPAFSNVPATSATAAQPASPAPAAPAPMPVITVPDSVMKLLYDSTKVNFKMKQKVKIEIREAFEDDDDDDREGPAKLTVREEKRIEKYKRREKETGNWLSGGFLASGSLLLVAALVLAIIGSGPAGWLAIIGGALFLAGFIFTMVALLGR